MYGFAGYSPVNFRDPLGLERVEVEPDGRQARRLQRKYNEAVAVFQELPEGEKAMQRIEEADATLRVVYNPERTGLKVDDHVYDEEGRLVESTLYVGSNPFGDIPEYAASQCTAPVER